MFKGFIRGWRVLGLLTALAFTLPTQSVAQRSGVEIWAVSCGRCHMIQPANKYDARGWERVGMHMTITARLTTAESEAVVAFLQSGVPTGGAQQGAAVEGSRASPPVAFVLQQPVVEVEDQFAQLCAPCHGREGKGDGVAAIALNPKPRDFTGEEFAAFTMEQIVSSITTGKGAMPAWGALLPSNQIGRLAEYVHALAHSSGAAATSFFGSR